MKPLNNRVFSYLEKMRVQIVNILLMITTFNISSLPYRTYLSRHMRVH